MNKDILKKIPGFRSDTWWKKLVAVIGYAYFFFIVFSQDGVTFYDRIINSLMVVVTYGTVFVLVFNIGNIRDKIYFFNRPKGKVRIVFIFIGIFFTVIVLNLALMGLNSLKTDQQIEYEVEQSNIRAASYMDSRIQALGPAEELTSDDVGNLQEIIAAYESMTPQQKSLLTQEDKINVLKKRLEELKSN